MGERPAYIARYKYVWTLKRTDTLTLRADNDAQAIAEFESWFGVDPTFLDLEWASLTDYFDRPIIVRRFHRILPEEVT